MRNWNPKTHPYRVRKVRAGGPHGWSDSVQTFQTVEEALKEMESLMKGGVYLHELDVVKCDQNGNWSGWTRLAERKINAKIKLNRNFKLERDRATLGPHDNAMIHPVSK